MKKLFAASVITLAAVVGCTQGTPGGPGTTDTTAKKPTYGQADDTFNLSVPVMSSSLQQGATTEVSIAIKRAKNFDKDVALIFTDLPSGVTVEPANPTIKHGDVDAKIVFKATDEAPLGDFKVQIAGHPDKGGDAQVEFKLAVRAKDSFTLSMPRAALKQGATKEVAIGITREKKFDQDVELKFGELPTGVTREPEVSIIKKGETEAKFTLTALDDAALGSFAIKVTGHPTEGADATNEFTLTVAKE